MSNEKVEMEIVFEKPQFETIQKVCEVFDLEIEQYILKVLENELNWLKEGININIHEIVRAYLKYASDLDYGIVQAR